MAVILSFLVLQQQAVVMALVGQLLKTEIQVVLEAAVVMLELAVLALAVKVMQAVQA
jgi:hypothetical protein